MIARWTSRLTRPNKKVTAPAAWRSIGDITPNVTPTARKCFWDRIELRVGTYRVPSGIGASSEVTAIESFRDERLPTAGAENDNETEQYLVAWEAF